MGTVAYGYTELIQSELVLDSFEPQVVTIQYKISTTEPLRSVAPAPYLAVLTFDYDTLRAADVEPFSAQKSDPTAQKMLKYHNRICKSYDFLFNKSQC